jgi:anti-sigma regulatory factor (Ser/Thr protein kinase)
MCVVVVAAQPRNLRTVREQLSRWLGEQGCPERAAAAIVLAVNEAVTNAVQHAYAPADPDGTVEVRATVEQLDPFAGALDGRRVRVRVRDHGRWRPDPHDRSDEAAEQGYGLAVMRALMAEVVITADPTTGTEVELISQVLPR